MNKERSSMVKDDMILDNTVTDYSHRLSEVYSQVSDQVWNQVRDQVMNQVLNQVWRQVRDE